MRARRHGRHAPDLVPHSLSLTILALANPLKARLAALPALAGWQVRLRTDSADRSELPAADLGCIGAGIADSKTGAAMVAPEWSVVLMARRGESAADALDAAFAAVFESLHNWMPGQHGGRGWEPLRLVRVQEPIFTDVGVVGYELTFSTAARYMGQQ